MPKLKSYPVVGYGLQGRRGRFITDKRTHQRIWLPEGRVRRARPWYPQGHGSRLIVRYKYYINTPELVRIKVNQARAERKAGVRVGTGLFMNPLADSPVITGVTKYARKKQQNPLSRKLGYQRKGRGGKKQSGRRSEQMVVKSVKRLGF